MDYLCSKNLKDLSSLEKLEVYVFGKTYTEVKLENDKILERLNTLKKEADDIVSKMVHRLRRPTLAELLFS